VDVRHKIDDPETLEVIAEAISKFDPTVALEDKIEEDFSHNVLTWSVR